MGAETLFCRASLSVSPHEFLQNSAVVFMGLNTHIRTQRRHEVATMPIHD
jgi:hypothetical protein